jgi:hypothetical protein
MDPTTPPQESWIGMYTEMGYQQLDRYLAIQAAFDAYLQDRETPGSDDPAE